MVSLWEERDDADRVMQSLKLCVRDCTTCSGLCEKIGYSFMHTSQNNNQCEIDGCHVRLYVLWMNVRKLIFA